MEDQQRFVCAGVAHTYKSMELGECEISVIGPALVAFADVPDDFLRVFHLVQLCFDPGDFASVIDPENSRAAEFRHVQGSGILIYVENAVMKGIPGRQQVPALRLARVKIVHVVSCTVLEEGFHLLLVYPRAPRSYCDGRRSDALSKEIVDGDVKVFLEP